ncbi:MAG: nitrile hydratase subunit beta [Pseudonocardiaceae bacterium]|nr:nitrile hydratase subunit beta [Pseudonocardiaceae bacterium]
MNGVHDLGGTDGLGPVTREQDEPVFHADWEKAVFAMFPATFVKGYFNLDQFRHGMERMHPVEYLSSRYYEHWLHSLESHVVEAGAVDRDELDRRTQHYLDHPDEPLPGTRDSDLVGFLETVMAQGASARREASGTARFSAGDRVRVGDDHPHGHTRRARYIRGKTGVIDRVHDAFIYPDSAGNGHGEDPQFVYTVRFATTDLWGPDSGDPRSCVYFDVWEPYLQSA